MNESGKSSIIDIIIIKCRKWCVRVFNNGDYNVLLTLMGLNIGGAETHVLELALELKRQGFHVVVASNGGVYEKDLAQAGIPHYQVPLHNKSIRSVFTALHRLRKIIRREHIHLVHAHGRIPAFISGILAKFMSFRFVTTAHWVFATGGGLKYITNWGEKVLAVSEDIKTYLMDNYHINPSDIYVTINGIDTDKFSPETDASALVEEFSLQPDSKKIVYISRMDADRAAVAFQLVEIAEELDRAVPGVEIVIVGGGNVFEKLREQAEAVNARAGRRIVTLTGARTDINRFCALADVFVGVSRSALEAMAAQKPVIVAGNEGYIGIFDEDKLAVGIDTNFCCRGCETSTKERLLADCLTLLQNAPEETQRLSEYGRNIILDMYSVRRMAEENIKMYKSVLDGMRYDFAMSGYYGFDNSGDEALLLAIIRGLRAIRDDVRICVLSRDPAKTEAEYGVHAINRYNIFKMRRVLKKTRCLLSGGGSLMQDVTSSKSLWYYMYVMRKARRLGCKVMVYANGIGPILRDKNKRNAAHALREADCITLRESGSLTVVRELGAYGDNVCVTADPALTLEPPDASRVASILEQEGIAADGRFIGIGVREWDKNCPDFARIIAQTADYAAEKYGLTPLLLPFKYPDDIAIADEICGLLEHRGYVVRGRYTSIDMLGLVGRCEAMLAMRLHALIYAAVTNVPTVGLVYDPKVNAFVEYMGQDVMFDTKALELQKLTGAVDDIMQNREQIIQKQSLRMVELRQKAARNAQMAFELIGE